MARFVGDAVRVAVILGLALAALAIVRAPAARRVLLATALAGALFMPLVSALAPTRIAVPVMPSSTHLERDTAGDAPVARADAAAKPAPREAPSAVATTATRPIDWTLVLVALWLGGVLVAGVRTAGGLVRARALVRRSRPARDWARVVERAQRATGVRANVRVADIAAPAVTGIFRPVVLVPSEAWSDERRLAVLMHEIAHIRQRDCAVQLIAQLACGLHWFNPLAWLAARRLRLERELAADDAVLASGTRATSYAADLLAIASAAQDDIPASALGMGARSHLTTRISAIVADRARRTLGRMQLAGIVTGASLVVVGAACAKPASSTAQASPPPSPASPHDPVTSTPAPAAPTTELQNIAADEYARLMADSGAKSGTVLILDANTGAVLAEVGASRKALITGSTLKPLVLATALDAGVVTTDERFDLEQGSYTYAGKTMHDAGKYGVMTVPEMLAVSSNIGFTKIFDRLGAARLEKGLRAFHFNPPPMTDHFYESAVVAIGEVVSIAPIDLARAYVALANGGEYVTANGRERVIKADTVEKIRPMLEGVVYSSIGTGKLAAVDGVRVAGKTGTASWDLPGGGEAIYASFVGFVPSTSPRYVILAGAEQPKDKDASGGTTAAPVFARVATRALAVK